MAIKPNDSSFIVLLCLVEQSQLYANHLKQYTKHDFKFRLGNLSTAIDSIKNKIKADMPDFDFDIHYDTSVAFATFIEAFNQQDDALMKDVLLQLVTAITDKRLDCADLVEVFNNVDKFKDFISRETEKQ